MSAKYSIHVLVVWLSGAEGGSSFVRLPDLSVQCHTPKPSFLPSFLLSFLPSFLSAFSSLYPYVLLKLSEGCTGTVADGIGSFAAFDVFELKWQKCCGFPHVDL